MLLFRSDKNYCVHLEQDGDDLWITTTNGYCVPYNCIVGNTEDEFDVKACLNGAQACFYPQQYMADNMTLNDSSSRVLSLARDAYEIDRALELALKNCDNIA